MCIFSKYRPSRKTCNLKYSCFKTPLPSWTWCKTVHVNETFIVLAHSFLTPSLENIPTSGLGFSGVLIVNLVLWKWMEFSMFHINLLFYYAFNAYRYIDYFVIFQFWFYTRMPIECYLALLIEVIVMEYVGIILKICSFFVFVFLCCTSGVVLLCFSNPIRIFNVISQHCSGFIRRLRLWEKSSTHFGTVYALFECILNIDWCSTEWAARERTVSTYFYGGKPSPILHFSFYKKRK